MRPVIFRSYAFDSLRSPSNSWIPSRPRRKQRTSSAETTQGQRVVTEPAANLPLWQVARAATAAPMLFKPMSFEVDRGREVRFLDGVLTENNPTMLGIREIEAVNPSHRVGMVVSIGTGRAGDRTGPKDKDSVISRIHEFKRAIFEPRIDEAHSEVSSYAKNNKHVSYYRFNAAEPFDIKFDEWKPKNGKPCAAHLEEHLHQYLANPDVSSNLRRNWSLADATARKMPRAGL